MRSLTWAGTLVTLLALTVACKKHTAPAEPAAQTSASAAPSASAPVEPPVRLTDEELDKLDVPTKPDFEVEAEKEIQPENLEAQIDTLEKEILADR